MAVDADLKAQLIVKNKNIRFLQLCCSVLIILVALLVNKLVSSGSDECKTSIHNNWSVLDMKRSDLYTNNHKRKEAKRLFEAASGFSGEKGEGRQGWLHLLAAYTYDNKDLNIVSNLIGNYEALKYGLLGYSVLLESNITSSEKDLIMSKDRQHELAEHLAVASGTMNGTKDLGPGCTTLMFASAVSRWDMSDLLPSDMNEAIYTQSVAEYEKLKASRPDLSATDLNHAFFRVQMAALDTSSSYWGPFKNIRGFPELVANMRRSVWTFLQTYHGWDEEAARRKASHPLVVWVSVHTADSVHQPHVTEDALVGGVYYVSVPHGSGKLHMYDPRGKHPLRDLDVPVSPPNPPFHRIVSLAPEESLLVLFPGWLVHSVGSASVKAFGHNVSNQSSVSAKGASIGDSKGYRSRGAQYRVSLSLNLKGEWSDTASAAFGCPTYKTPR